MAFNLVTTPWLEVKHLSGKRYVISPAQITTDFKTDPIIALDFPRPDWNAALTEFLIGLCYLASGPEDEEDWADLFHEPPTPERIEKQLSPFVKAFDFDGDGPRAFQDYDALDKQEVKPLSGLLIEAPGENALRNNSDLFIKREGVNALSLAYAAAALITLQTYAPSGGAGHRTSMRGGGPLTTLLAPHRKGTKYTTLWDLIWANVPKKESNDEIHHEKLFPWLASTLTSEKGQMVTRDTSPSALAFFACPRRIRLEFSEQVTCDLSGTYGKGAVGLRTQNYGANYMHWLHPLSPYRQDKKSGLLPIHPHVGPADYGDWIGWWGWDGKPASALSLWHKRRMQVANLLSEQESIHAHGFDMDNMKARQWLQARFPWVEIGEGAFKAYKGAVQDFISGTDEAARAISRNAKLALYGIKQDTHYTLPDNLPMDALQEPKERLWQETEGIFREQLNKLSSILNNGEAETNALKEEWLKLLRKTALHIFDETVDIDGLTDENPHRLLWARNRLNFEFSNHTKASVRKALGLSVIRISEKEAV